jgi:predicted phosphodiesterase
VRLFIISDLHLSDGRALSTFGWREDAFIEAMEAIREGHAVDRVVLNGDVFDLYHSKYRHIADHNRKLVDYLAAIDAVFIKGNHDRALEHTREFCSIVNSRGEKIHIEHGHRADVFNGTGLGRGLGRVFFHLLVSASRFARPCAWYFGCVHRMEARKDRRTRNSNRHLRYASKLLRHNDVVVLGHTHKIEVRQTDTRNGRKRYFNSGSCSLGRMQGIVLDTETLEHTAIRFDPFRRGNGGAAGIAQRATAISRSSSVTPAPVTRRR